MDVRSALNRLRKPPSLLTICCLNPAENLPAQSAAASPSTTMVFPISLYPSPAELRRAKLVQSWLTVRRPGECKSLISSYLRCLKSAKGVNDEECRVLAKGYLKCRMDK